MGKDAGCNPGLTYRVKFREFPVLKTQVMTLSLRGWLLTFVKDRGHDLSEKRFPVLHE